MPSENPPKKISLEEFLAAKDSLIQELTEALELEVSMEDFELEEHEDENLFETPTVDSKSVVKLSPIIEEITGRKIKPEWIRPGGYDSVEEAVSDLIRQIELDLTPSGSSNNE